MNIVIAGRNVGPDAPPYILAEMSGNHNHDLNRALAIVDAAADAGAHGLKLQTYTAETMTLNIARGAFVIDDPKSLWHGRTLYDLYDEAHTPWEWHGPIMERCREKGIACFSTPFDATAVEFLESLNVPAYKIASFESADLPLLRKVGATGKPVILSTGMATVGEIEESVTTLRKAGCGQIVLLKCTSSYPATPENSNVRTIPHMAELFGTQVGLSDHTMGVGASVAAVAMGATLIEKHFTLSRADGGVDAAFSLEPTELSALVVETERAWQAMGKVTYGGGASEEGSRQFRRSIYVAASVKAGETFTEKNVRLIRPGFGLAPRFYETVIGKKASRDIEAGTPMSWDLVG